MRKQTPASMAFVYQQHERENKNKKIIHGAIKKIISAMGKGKRVRVGAEELK